MNPSEAGNKKETTCSGIVTDSQGNPVADIKIEIRQFNPFTKKVETYYAQTDEQGHYDYTNIEWPYTVGVTWSHKTSPEGGHKLHYVRRNNTFNSSQKVDFKLKAFPTGSAGISGRVTDQHGKPFQDFTVRIHRKVDWDDYSGEYLIDYGYMLPFSSKDGKFEVKDLASGIYTVTVFNPQKWDRYEFPELQEVTLENDKTADIACDVFEKPAYYGRVLFEDGKPAYIDSPPWPGARTYVKLPSSQIGEIPAVIDRDGCFTAYFTDKEFEQLYNWESEIAIYYPSFESKGLFVDHGTFPVELLSKEKSKAGVITRKNRGSIIGIPADFNEFGINLSPADVNDKAILVCFFDMEQRPSRNCILQVNKRIQELSAKDIVTIAVQASKVNRAEFDQWKKENTISFPAGAIRPDEPHTRWVWGIRSLPWLILTDKEHIVKSYGFSIDELDEKITKLGEK
jgi:hypothetical protein